MNLADDRPLDLVAGSVDLREFYHPEAGQPPLQDAACQIDLAVRRSRAEF